MRLIDKAVRLLEVHPHELPLRVVVCGSRGEKKHYLLTKAGKNKLGACLQGDQTAGK